MTNGNLSTQNDSFRAKPTRILEKRSVDYDSEETVPETKTESPSEPASLDPQQKELEEAEKNVTILEKSCEETEKALTKKREDAVEPTRKYEEAKRERDKLDKTYSEIKKESDDAKKAVKEWETAVREATKAGTAQTTALGRLGKLNASLVDAQTELERVKGEPARQIAALAEQALLTKKEGTLTGEIKLLTETTIPQLLEKKTSTESVLNIQKGQVTTSGCEGRMDGDCKGENEALSRMNNDFQLADGKHKKAENDLELKTYEQGNCTEKLTSLSDELSKLNIHVPKNKARVEAEEANVNEAGELVADSQLKIGKINATKITADETLEKKKEVKEAAEGKSTHTPAEIEAARLAADQSQADFIRAEVTKDSLDTDIKDLDEKEVECKGELIQAKTTFETLKQQARKDEPSTGTATIIGIAVFVVLIVLVGIGGGIGFFLFKRRKERMAKKAKEAQTEPSNSGGISNSKHNMPKVKGGQTYEPCAMEDNEKITSTECEYIDARALPKEIDKERASTFGKPAKEFTGNEIKFATPFKAEIHMYSDSKEEYGNDDCNTTYEKRERNEEDELTGQQELTATETSGNVHSHEELWDFLETIMTKSDLGVKELEWKYEHVTAILATVEKIFKRGEVLVECPAPTDDGKVAVFGDLHGQLADLIRHLRNLNLDKTAPKLSINTMRLIFMGDYVDRGKEQLEVILFVFIMKILFPNDMFPLRGNHEFNDVNNTSGGNFECELKRRFGDKGHTLWATFNTVFSWMPLACRLGGKILCVHGGIAAEWKTVEDVLDRKKVPRPLIKAEESAIATGIVWADPMIGIKGWMFNISRRISFSYGMDVLQKFLTDNNLTTLIRGHQVMDNGVHFLGKAFNLICVFSASNSSPTGNFSGVLTIDKDLVIKPVLSYLRANATEAQCKAEYDRKNQTHIFDFRTYQDHLKEQHEAKMRAAAQAALEPKQSNGRNPKSKK